jgi:hypothetical protein
VVIDEMRDIQYGWQRFNERFKSPRKINDRRVGIGA